jgi:opacity protein-like surface antigen
MLTTTDKTLASEKTKFKEHSFMRRTTIVVGSIFLLTLAAIAQENRSEISVQGTGFFTKSASGNGTAYSTSQTGGFLTTYRYHLNHWISAEAAYGYDLNSQKYLLLSSSAFRIQSGIHQMTGSLVLNLPSRTSSRFNPYFLAGGGALVFAPTTNQVNSLSGAQTRSKGVFVYGVGVNYAILKRLSLRAEYRGLVYGTPDFGFGALSTSSFTHTAQPSVGLTYRF